MTAEGEKMAMGVYRTCGAAVFLAVMLFCGGCSGGAAQAPGDGAQAGQAGEAKEPLSVAEVYREIEQGVELKSPASMDDEFIQNYYGINAAALEEYVFSMSEDAAQAEAVILMKVKDEGDLDEIEGSLQAVVEEKKNEMENYIPEQFAIVEKSKVVRRGSYIWLVISENADAITETIESGLFP